jgi:hypothetical protein
MKVVEKSELVTYMYRTNEEFENHREEMEKSGWEFQNTLIINDWSICAEYKKILNTEIYTVLHLVRNARVSKVVVKDAFGTVLYYGERGFFLKQNRISDRNIGRMIAQNSSTQNGVMTIIV